MDEIRPDAFTARDRELPSPSSRIVGPIEQLHEQVQALAVQLQATEKWNDEQVAQIAALTARVAELERGQGEPLRIGGDA